jgi:hypothetical protein
MIKFNNSNSSKSSSENGGLVRKIDRALWRWKGIVNFTFFDNENGPFGCPADCTLPKKGFEVIYMSNGILIFIDMQYFIHSSRSITTSKIM